MSTKETLPPVEGIAILDGGSRVVLALGEFKYYCYLLPNGEWGIYRSDAEQIFRWHPFHKHVTNILRLAL